jgi:hypothetical protein
MSRSVEAQIRWLCGLIADDYRANPHHNVHHAIKVSEGEGKEPWRNSPPSQEQWEEWLAWSGGRLIWYQLSAPHPGRDDADVPEWPRVYEHAVYAKMPEELNAWNWPLFKILPDLAVCLNRFIAAHNGVFERVTPTFAGMALACYFMAWKPERPVSFQVHDQSWDEPSIAIRDADGKTTRCEGGIYTRNAEGGITGWYLPLENRESFDAWVTRKRRAWAGHYFATLSQDFRLCVVETARAIVAEAPAEGTGVRALGPKRQPQASQPPYIPSPAQQRILNKLDCLAMTLRDLARVLRVDESGLHRHLVILMKCGLIKNWRRVGGYYRPDAPPAKFADALKAGASEEAQASKRSSKTSSKTSDHTRKRKR